MTVCAKASLIGTARIEIVFENSTLSLFQLEKEGRSAIIYARATRPAIPASKARAGFPLLLAAPVKVATGGAL